MSAYFKEQLNKALQPNALNVHLITFASSIHLARIAGLQLSFGLKAPLN